MNTATIPADRLACLLRDAAAGMLADMAAVDLICAHGHFLHDPGFRRIIAAGSSITTGQPLAVIRQPGAGGRGVRGGPGHCVAVGSGAGRRWGGRAGPGAAGPEGPSKLTPQLAARIRELDAAGATLHQIAAATRVSTFTRA